MTAEFLSDIIRARPAGAFRPPDRAAAARIERLIQWSAWTDAALALIELDLPQWQLRRIAYDGGEWRCALSREGNCRTGSINRSRPAMPIWRWRS